MSLFLVLIRLPILPLLIIDVIVVTPLMQLRKRLLEETVSNKLTPTL